MKVKELIEQLKDFNPDANVSLLNSEEICLSYISIYEGEIITKHDTRQIFIEAVDDCAICNHQYKFENVRFCEVYDKKCSDIDECFQFKGCE